MEVAAGPGRTEKPLFTCTHIIKGKNKSFKTSGKKKENGAEF